MQDLDVAVARAQRRRRQDRAHRAAPPRRCRGTLRRRPGRAPTSAGVPRAIAWPKFSTTTRVAGGAHQRHVVLDQQHARCRSRAIARIVSTSRAGLRRVHAGRGLVEHHHRRCRRPARARSPAGAGRRTAARWRCAARSTCAIPARSSSARASSSVEPAGARERAGGEVRAHVERAEQADVLVGARDAGARDAVRRQPVEARAVERDRARRQRREAGRRVDQRRLAGAVGADQAQHAARLDRQRDAAQRVDAAVANADVLEDAGVRPLRPDADRAAAPERGKAAGREQDHRRAG